MGEIVKILVSLGVDYTVFYQMGIFLVTFLVIEQFLFKPYLAAYMERRKRTVGSEDVAADIEQEIESLESVYSNEAKQENMATKEIFETHKQNAVKETQAIILTAQEEASQKINASKSQLAESYAQAKEELQNYIPELSSEMEKRLLN